VLPSRTTRTIVALRNYLEGYAKAHEQTSVTVSSAAPAGSTLVLKPTAPVAPPPVISLKPSSYISKPYKQVTGHEDISMF
jgi:hypothetical protein